MVAIATAAGFSSALGAFVMGSLLAETIEGEHIEHSIKNIKDLFGHVELKAEDSREIYEKTQNEISVLDNYGDKAMCDIILNRVPAFLKDKEMCKTGLKEEYLLNIVMLKRGGEALSVEKDTILAKNDEIVVFGDYGLIKELFMGD
jgi:hypothetical protein